MNFLNKITIILLAGILIFLSYCIFSDSCSRVGNWVKLNEDAVVVPKDTLAKWDSLANLPPIIKWDTAYRDTGSVKIVYQDLPSAEPDPLDSMRYTLSDSLKTDYFTAALTYRFMVNNRIDSLLSATWTYLYLGPHQIIKTIEKQIPVPMPYEVIVPAEGFYLGVHTDVSQYMLSYGGNMDFIRGRFLYGGYLERQLLFDERKSIAIGGRISYKIK